MSEELTAQLRYQRTERLLVAAYLLCVMAVQAHFVHDGWYMLLHPPPALAAAMAATAPGTPVLYAPDVYRVGMQLVSIVLDRFVRDPSAQLTCIDFVFGFAALFALYLLHTSRVPLHPRARAQRVLTLAFLLAVLHFPLQWVVPYQRPETMPMALYLATATLLLQRVRDGMGWGLGLLALTIATAFVRSDVPFMFGMAVLLLGLCGNTLHEIGPRRICIAAGAAVTGVSAAVQAYLQFVRFPHASYPPGVPMVMLHYNARFHSVATMCIALLPVLAVAALALAVRVRMHSRDWVCVAAAAIYLPLWITVGSTAEVRIYVPLMLLLCPLATRVLAAALGFREDVQPA